MNKLIILTTLLCLCTVSGAGQQTKKPESTKDTVKEQPAPTRCKFNDAACTTRPESKATRALKRLGRF